MTMRTLEEVKTTVRMYAVSEGWLLSKSDFKYFTERLEASETVEQVQNLFDSYANNETRIGMTFEEFLDQVEDFIEENIDDFNSWKD